MEKHSLKAGKRTIAGRKVKNLRKSGILPANIYGKKVKSQAVQVAEKEFTSVFVKAGETGLVELLVDGEKHHVLIHSVQYHPVSGSPCHVDFLQVDLKEKVTAKVPVVLVGEAPAVKEKTGVLLTLVSEIEVEALPADLPEKLEVDISNLSAIDQSIKVEQLKVSDKVKVLADLNIEIVKVAPLVSKEAEKMAAEEAAAAAVAAAATEAAATPEGVEAGKPVEAAPAAPAKESPKEVPPEAGKKE
ncbi:50S ribosomal protein L25 [Candidatus Gottesmanbacteria bacterium]|nr:50S ribosomal protein L25 [Candidatus Gottesmanbacteria bacterium]